MTIGKDNRVEGMDGSCPKARWFTAAPSDPPPSIHLIRLTRETTCLFSQPVLQRVPRFKDPLIKITTNKQFTCSLTLTGSRIGRNEDNVGEKVLLRYVYRHSYPLRHA